MNRFPIGVIIDSFRTDTYTTIRKAAELGADSIQMYYSTSGENSPESLTPQREGSFLILLSLTDLSFPLFAKTSEGAFSDLKTIPNS